MSDGEPETVPLWAIEPTEEMIAAGWKRANEIGPSALGVITDSTCAEIFRAMVKARPQ